MEGVSEVLCRVVSVVISVDIPALVVSGTDGDGWVVVASTLDVSIVMGVVSAGEEIPAVVSTIGNDVSRTVGVVTGAMVELSSAVDVVIISASSVVDISIVVLENSVDNADVV